MARLLIIADDFTGALDTGVQFSKMGIPTQVFVYQNTDWGKMGIDAEVLVVDTESRHLEANEAYRRVFELCSQAKERGVKFFYKKTDSTLRGNLGAELSALMDACNLQHLQFIPAYPKAGRTTKQGYQYVDGTLLDQTAFANDPLNPIIDGYIPNIIKEQTDKLVHTVNTSSTDLETCLYDKNGMLVLDAASEKDMMQIAHVLAEQRDIFAVAGCAGFAPYLPELFALKTNPNMKKGQLAHKPMLLVSGSVNEVSMAQVQYAEKAGIESLLLKPEELVSDSYVGSSAYEALVEAAVQGLDQTSYLILKTADRKGDIIPLTHKAKSPSGKGTYKDITSAIGSLVRDIMNRMKVGTLVVFGGDTALGIIEQLNCTAIVPQYEVLTGIPLSTVESDTFDGTLVTKAGGFGNEGTLMNIITYIEEGR